MLVKASVSQLRPSNPSRLLFEYWFMFRHADIIPDEDGVTFLLIQGVPVNFPFSPTLPNALKEGK